MISSANRDAVGVVRSLEKAIRLLLLYPASHPNCSKALEEGLQLLREYHQRYGALALEIRRNGLEVDEEPLNVPREAGGLDLSQVLYPEGIRSLALAEGIEGSELFTFMETVAGSSDGDDEEQLGLGRDLLDALQTRDLPHVQYLVYDPLSPAGVHAERFDPTIALVASRIRELHEDFARALGTSAQLDTLLEREAADLSRPSSTSAFPEHARTYLDSGAGKQRRELFDPAELSGGEEQLRAAEIALEADEAAPGMLREDALYMLKDAALGMVADLRFGPLLVLLADVKESEKEFSTALAGRLGDPVSLAVLSRALQSQRQLDPEALQSAKAYLEWLGRPAVPGMIKVFSSIILTGETRELFEGFLRGWAQRAPESLIKLAEAPREVVARQGLSLLCEGGRQSEGFAMVQKIANDPRHPRAALAAEIIEAASGDKERTRLLTAIEKSKVYAERIGAWQGLKDLPPHPEILERAKAVVSAGGFVSREKEEQEAALDALVALGGKDVAETLRELSQRTGIFRRKATMSFGKLAGERLRKLGGGK
ncbi:MAG TPA: hypothetical protein DEA08_13050 [Planctomycetes bacterium]|nr:hypothetical protein [Planctomycetota bacterium]